jgi:hypothetical protein
MLYVQASPVRTPYSNAAKYRPSATDTIGTRPYVTQTFSGHLVVAARRSIYAFLLMKSSNMYPLRK